MLTCSAAVSFVLRGSMCDWLFSADKHKFCKGPLQYFSGIRVGSLVTSRMSYKYCYIQQLTLFCMTSFINLPLKVHSSLVVLGVHITKSYSLC
jgi:hypothetical protein